MTFKAKTSILVLPLVPVVALTLTLTAGAASVSASSGRGGRFTATKDCTPFATGGNFCTLVNISDPKLALLLDGKNLYYESAPFALADGSLLLDSNVALDAGPGDKARGRCTFDFTNGMGLCTIEDGFGALTRLRARIDVDCTAGLICSVKGTYGFGEDD